MASKSKENRIIITMACTECKSRNYTTSKNRMNDKERLQLNKYCPRCHKYQGHREAK